MEIEPKKISGQDVKTSIGEAFDIMKRNPLPYFLVYAFIFFNVYLSTLEPYWLIVNPIVYGLAYVSLFELTCTLRVGYKGSVFQKLKVSAKASVKTLLALTVNHPFYCGVYLLIFYSLQARFTLVYMENPNDVNAIWMSFKSLAWVGFFLSGFCNMMVSLRMGCISMFLTSIKDYEVVNKLVMDARIKNTHLYLIGGHVGLLFVLIGVFTSEILSSLFIGFAIIVGFFIFEKIFEPPHLKQKQEQEENLTNVVPDAT